MKYKQACVSFQSKFLERKFLKDGHDPASAASARERPCFSDFSQYVYMYMYTLVFACLLTRGVDS